MRKLFAEMWDCGDDECDCSQPEIVEREVDLNFRAPSWRGPKNVATGPFYSQPDGKERREQIEWLVENAIKYKVENLEDVLKLRKGNG
jgi:hypothetical protein